MPRECGYLLGGFVAESVAAVCGFFAWLPYHTTTTISQQDQLWESQRALEIEQIRLETVKLRAERLRLEAMLPGSVENDENNKHIGVNGEEEKTMQSGSPTMTTATDLQAA